MTLDLALSSTHLINQYVWVLSSSFDTKRQNKMYAVSVEAKLSNFSEWLFAGVNLLHTFLTIVQTEVQVWGTLTTFFSAEFPL